MLVMALFVLTPALFCSGGNPAKTVAHYTVSSKGFAIGDVTTIQRSSEDNGVASIHFETRTTVKASFLWLGYQLETLEKGILRSGDLVSYSRKGRENGTLVDVEGRLDHSSFRFDVSEPGATSSIVIPRNSYDFSTMECPEARLDFTDKSHVILRVLDVEKMAVVNRDYQLVRNTSYPIGGKEMPCRIVEFSDRNKKARRWITWDGAAVVMYRQDGTSNKSSYSVQATAVTNNL